jgi:hypothetical protein
MREADELLIDRRETGTALVVSVVDLNLRLQGSQAELKAPSAKRSSNSNLRASDVDINV